MSLLGKILAILNVLAALGFAFLALADYSKRQSWSYQVFLHDTAIDGLPVDKDELGLDGRPRLDDLGKETQQEIFKQAGGQPVATQLDELERVNTLVQNKLSQSDLDVPDPLNPKGKLKLQTPVQRYAWVLLPLARTASMRDGLIERMRQPQAEGDMGWLDATWAWAMPAQLEAAFETARKKKNPADPGDQRELIADLLLALSELPTGDAPASDTQPALADTTAYKRMLAVVGLKEAVAAVDRRTIMLEHMANEAGDSAIRERLAFVNEHQALLGRIQDLSEQLQIEDDFLQGLKNQVAAQKQLVSNRADEVKKLDGQLAAARKKTQQMLDEQTSTQQAVFDAQLKLRDANQENQELLRKIQALENRR
jgi:hypothetical protein